MKQTIQPTDREHWLSLRSQDVTSTESSALFGVHEYLTPYELWHRKKGHGVPVEENHFMKWGNRLQDPIAYGIAEDNGLKIRKMDEYIRDTELRIGSSFDFAIEEDGILEIKNVSERAFETRWKVEGDVIEAPLYIEAQVQHQLLVSGRKFALIGALVGGNTVHLIRREPDLEIHERIKEAAKAFWGTVERNEEPAPNFEKDARFIRQLYSFANPGTVKDATDDSAIQVYVENYRQLTDAIKELEKKKDATKAALLSLMGDNEKMKGSGWSVSASMIGPCQVSYEKRAYRDFRITFKKD